MPKLWKRHAERTKPSVRILIGMLNYALHSNSSISTIHQQQRLRVYVRTDHGQNCPELNSFKSNAKKSTKYNYKMTNTFEMFAPLIGLRTGLRLFFGTGHECARRRPFVWHSFFGL